MPNRLPILSISSPHPNAVVGTAPFAVTGLVTAPGMPEPVAIHSISVQIDSQPAVHATITHIPVPGDSQVEVTFSATVQITGGQDPHTVTVTVISDAGIPVSGTVIVTAGLRFVAPAAWVDILIPVTDPTEVPLVAARLQSLLGTVAQRIARLSLVSDLLTAGQMLVGPNIVPIPNALTLRVGFWILDFNFPAQELIQPTSDFPLPQLTADAATGSFTLVPLLPPGQLSTTGPAQKDLFAFALSIPTLTLQTIVDALLPTINRAAQRHNGTVNSITVKTGGDGQLIGEVSASWEGIGISGEVTEILGLQQRLGTQSNMGAVLSSSVSSSLDGLIGLLGPIITDPENSISGKVESNIATVLNDLPAWIPFRSSTLPDSFQADFPFPMAVLNFKSFGTSTSGIVGSGSGSLANRDQTMVALNLIGPSSFPNYSYGIIGSYEVLLTAFDPDNNQMTWQMSGVPRTNIVNIDAFSQEGSFATTFPIPGRASSGNYTFTLSVNGEETCATDPTKVLNGSTSLLVTVTVAKGHQPEVAEAAASADASVQPKMPLVSAPERGRVA